VKRKLNASSNVSGWYNRDFNLTVYPNPATSDFTVSWPNLISGDSRIELLNASGQLIYTAIPDKQTMNNGKILFKSDNWPAGIYIIRMKAQGVVSSAKINIVH
jgi:hypothetical protein